MKEKIKPKKIFLCQATGRNLPRPRKYPLSIDEQPITDKNGNEVVFHCIKYRELNEWRTANDTLTRWAETIPNCEKTDFLVMFEDGLPYRGVLDLCNIEKRGFPNLQRHIRNFAKLHSGKYRPPHISEEDYKIYVKTHTNKEQRKYYNDILEKYDVGFYPSKTMEQLRREKIHFDLPLM